MSPKEANVFVRVEPEIKEKAEAIFLNLGIPADTAIDLFYRQVVLTNGAPFGPMKLHQRPRARDEMSKEEFDARMAEGLAQAKADISSPMDEVFDRLFKEISDV